MCACGEHDPSYVCLAHRGTPLDPGYLLSHLPDGEEERVEQGHVSEYEVQGG